jgi:hypothetical protein
MKITIDVRDEWLADFEKATGDLGSNDDEHDLLAEIADDVAAALPKPRPRYSFSVVELAGSDWHQGEILRETLNTDALRTAPEIGDEIGNCLDEWIERCSSSDEDGETWPPALEINVTLALGTEGA